MFHDSLVPKTHFLFKEESQKLRKCCFFSWQVLRSETSGPTKPCPHTILGSELTVFLGPDNFETGLQYVSTTSACVGKGHVFIFVGAVGTEDLDFVMAVCRLSKGDFIMT